MRRRRRVVGIGVVVAAALVGGLLVDRWLHGHVVAARQVPNHGVDFDFSRPPCAAAERGPVAADEVAIRYLGVGGLYVEWRGAGLMTAPFYSNHGLLRAGLGSGGWNAGAIRAGLGDTPVERVGAVLVGHGHYDHLGDVPPVLLEYATTARVYLNRSGAHMLAAFPGLRGRSVALDDRLGVWITPTRTDGTALPLRIMALRSGHAPQLRWYHYAQGEVDEPWQSWDDKPLRAMREGLPLAFLVDLLDADGATVFRLHYQDAASTPPAGFPPEAPLRERAVDLAVLCLPSSWNVVGYPQELLERTRARHALIGHYEDFFRAAGKPLRFVGMTTDRRVAQFIDRVDAEMSRPGHDRRGPSSPVCGPSGPSWTMALPGEWLHFRAMLPNGDGTPATGR